MVGFEFPRKAKFASPADRTEAVKTLAPLFTAKWQALVDKSGKPPEDCEVPVIPSLSDAKLFQKGAIKSPYEGL